VTKAFAVLVVLVKNIKDVGRFATVIIRITSNDITQLEDVNVNATGTRTGLIIISGW
jgi:hypothetical protein